MNECHNEHEQDAMLISVRSERIAVRFGRKFQKRKKHKSMNHRLPKMLKEKWLPKIKIVHACIAWCNYAGDKLKTEEDFVWSEQSLALTQQ